MLSLLLYGNSVSEMHQKLQKLLWSSLNDIFLMSEQFQMKLPLLNNCPPKGPFITFKQNTMGSFPVKSSLLLWYLPVLLVIFVLAGHINSVQAQDPPSDPTSDPPIVHKKPDETAEFVAFCAKQEEHRRDPESIKKGCKRIHVEDFHDDDLRMLFALFMMILWGALIRTALRAFKLSLPYTVVLMFSGIIIGVIAKYQCYDMYTYTAIARIKPEIILFVFLPVLIFETAFGISSHVFLKACKQILLAALPGMVICTGLTALLCYQFFSEYNWTLLQALFYGSIISATDPVAVVAILKELGVAESLSVIIDGESLLNDGVAILLFEIFKEMLETEASQTTGELALHIFLMFLQIAIGGPVFGIVMAKIAIFCLARIFNDAIVEITITLVAAYLTYYIAEDMLHVSGVCAVVLLGITMSSEKTCISPEILEEVHEFWEMLAHLANTVLFFITGIVIAERGSRDLGAVDVYYLILLYCALNFIRFIMLLILSPLLSRTGYGLTWQNMIVMMWGGLRGAVGICLSLQVYEDTHFCKQADLRDLGPKILFHTAGIVLLTLTINGTTTKKLLDLLQLTAVSVGRVEEMQIAVKHVMDSQKKAVIMLKHDRYLADASWDYILTFTKIENPYKNVKVKQKKVKVVSSIISLKEETREHECPGCHILVENEPSNEEYRIMTEEARLRVIKAMKISYWTQFEQGILSEDAVRILASLSDSFTDMELTMIHTKDLAKHWEVRGVIPWLRSKMMNQFGENGIFSETIPKKPDNKYRYPFYWIVSRTWFDPMMTCIILCNMIPAVWEFVLDVQTHGNTFGLCDQTHKTEREVFVYLNWIFGVGYLLEFIIKVVGRGCKDYWSNKWNYIDFFVLIISIVDIILSFYPCDSNARGVGFTKILKGLRLFRVIRSIRLIKPIIPFILNFLNARINKTLFLGYDIAVGYIWALDDVLKYINQMAENPHVAKKLRLCLERERLEAIREIGLIQREHPGIAIAVKTRHASRSVLNNMRNALADLRLDGLLDDKENQLLTIELEERMKRLWNSPAYIAPASPEVLLENLSWVYGNNELKDYIFSNATMISFELGDIITAAGDQNNGIYVITAGMVKITYDPITQIIEDRDKYGAIPNMEIFRDFEFDKHEEDFYSCGTVLGESGCLTNRVRSATVVCDTDGVQAYHIPREVMEEAFKIFSDPYDSLENRLWRSCGIRRGSAYLPSTTFYQTWGPEKIHIHLERSCVPIGPQFNVISIPAYVLDIFVIEGYAQDYFTGEIYIAPCLIPRNCTRLIFIDNPKALNRVLMITQDDIGKSLDDDLSRCVIASYKFRRGIQHKDDEEDGQEKKAMKLNFSIRQKKRRRSSVYNTDDQDIQKDTTIRRRIPNSSRTASQSTSTTMAQLTGPKPDI